jgi:hypothetical protein
MSGVRSKLKRLMRVPPFTDTNGPGIGPDKETPLGDTPEVHDEIAPRDIPLDNPSRREAERHASGSGGSIRGDVD